MSGYLHGQFASAFRSIGVEDLFSVDWQETRRMLEAVRKRDRRQRRGSYPLGLLFSS